LRLSRMLTDRGTEFCGSESHEYELYLAVEDIDHTRTKAKSPQTNGICERFHRTVLDEFYRVAFRKKIYRTIDELQADLDAWIVDYNSASQHPSVYAIAGNRSCWRFCGPAGCLAERRARSTRAWAAESSRAARLKSQGPSGSGCIARMSSLSAARRSVLGLT